MYAYQLSSPTPGPVRSPGDATAHAENPTAMGHGAPDVIYNASPLWSPTGAGIVSHVTLPLALLGGGTLLISPHAIGGSSPSAGPHAEPANEQTEPMLAAAVADAYVSGQQLRDAWGTMVEGWSVRAVALLCEKGDAIASDIPRDGIRNWAAELVHNSLTYDLDQICSGQLRVDVLGLNAPMPSAMQAALVNAMQTEIEADALLAPTAEAADMAERDRLLPLLGAPAIDLLQHPILGPLFEALHRSVPIPSTATLASACISTSGDRR